MPTSDPDLLNVAELLRSWGRADLARPLLDADIYWSEETWEEPDETLRQVGDFFAESYPVQCSELSALLVLPSSAYIYLTDDDADWSVVHEALTQALGADRWWVDEGEDDLDVDALLASMPPVEQPTPRATPCGWRGLKFRSRSEQRIAEALDAANVAIIPNARMRLGVTADHRQNLEPDFIVIADGKLGILEVHGEPFHPAERMVAEDERGRRFREHGVRVVEHYDATECYRDPGRVAAEFLRLLALNG